MSMAICVFCSSQDSIAPKYFEVARELGAEIGRRGNTLVYGAGGAGLMGAVARAARAHGARVVGVVPEALHRTGIIFEETDELIVTKDLRERWSSWTWTGSSRRWCVSWTRSSRGALRWSTTGSSITWLPTCLQPSPIWKATSRRRSGAGGRDPGPGRRSAGGTQEKRLPPPGWPFARRRAAVRSNAPRSAVRRAR